MDPNGRVFFHNARVYRALYPQSAAPLLDFLKTQTCQNLMATGALVTTTAVKNDAPPPFQALLEHAAIASPTYPFEWVPAALKSAALATVSLAETLLKTERTLSDASPWNILFQGTKPVFIDFTSITPIDPRYLWIPYQQWCNLFYHPLLLASARQGHLARRLLTDDRRGVAASEVQSLLSPWEKLTLPSYFSRVALPQVASRWIRTTAGERRLRAANQNIVTRIPTNVRHRFFSGLRRTLERLPIPTTPSNWTDYYSTTEVNALARKKQLFANVLTQLRPRNVLDVGCNTGVFSVMAAESGAHVIAMDCDESSVAALYSLADQRNLPIQPIIMDIVSPSPAYGWCGQQHNAASTRLQAELVCAFALIHHLVFSQGQSFARIVASLRDFAPHALIVEFVAADDTQAQRLQRRIGFDTSWYTLNNFQDALSEAYQNVTLLGTVSPTRTVLLATHPR